MHWNYRIVRKEGWFGIHEAFYDDNNKLSLVTVEPEAVQAEDETELKEVYDMMAEAFRAPVVNYEDVPEEGAQEM